uniref:BET bromodomain protein n=1 Tax=Pithovirus LCPAC403 TaxID=2506596 RepID=A0A481ZCH1_9VIRU|nr:MAG: BET bromodomain protein [Pithovirus LCPAC403]
MNNTEIPSFYRDLETLDVEPISNSHLCKLINTLSKERIEHVYLIMLLYGNMNMSTYPGQDNNGQGGAIFSVEKLPKQLLILIGKYVVCKVS